MRTAVLVADALGFKGIWKRRDAVQLRDCLRHIVGSIRGFPSLLLGNLAMPTVLLPGSDARKVSAVEALCLGIHAASFSDTIIFTCSGEVNLQYFPKAARFPEVLDAFLDASLLLTVVAAGSALAFFGGNGAIPSLAYRGAISVGECLVDRDTNVFIGPAIDEAAMFEGVPNAALIMLTPSALERQEAAEGLGLDILREVFPLVPPLVEYAVPTKEGRAHVSRVVNPFWALAGYAGQQIERLSIEQLADRFCEELLDSFIPETPEVLAKRENTATFLDHARDQSSLSVNQTD